MTYENRKIMRILWTVCIIPLIVGIMLWDSSTTETVYPVGEYWVAKEYSHVYETY